MSSLRGASSSRGRGKEKAKPPADSVAVAQMVATEVMDKRYVQIRKYTRDMAYFERGMGGVPTEQVVGGFAKSFRFVYTPGQSIAQGVMRIEHGYGRHEEYEVTIVILNPVEAQDGVGAQRIVDQTKKLADFPVIAEAHLSAYCENIKRWVVVYEKFDGYFYETVKEKENTDEKNENIAKFQLFKDKGKTELTDHWRITIRKFIEVLSFARVRNVFHGGLSRKGSYVVCSGVVKLIDVARRTVGQQPDYVTRDLKDLCKYFGDDTFLNATSSKEWISLDYLLKSDAMASDGWEDAALNHPIRLSSATDKLTSYGAAEVFMWSSNTGAQRYEFSNVLYCLLGSDYRGKKINDFIKEDPNAAIYKAKLTGGNYNGPIYCDIIQYVRNIILHPPDSWNDEFIAKDVAKLFPGLMSMAYSVAKVPRAEWKKLLKGRTDLPYKT